MRFWVGLAIAGFAGALCLPLRAQTLAHKNWAGSGITVDRWYDSAVIYELDPLTFQDSDGDGFGDLRGVTERLTYLESLGVDAVLLSPLPLNPPGSAHAFDPEYGTEEDFAELQREASKHRIRLLVGLPAEQSAAQITAVARFWLSRGVAGLALKGEPERLAGLRRLAAGYPGARILLWDGAKAIATGRRAAPEPEVTIEQRLTADADLTPALLRSALAGANLASDGEDLPRSFDRFSVEKDRPAMAKLMAAALLLGRGSPLLYAGQEVGMAGAGDPEPMQWGGAGFSKGSPWVSPGPNDATANMALEDAEAGSLLNWYRRLALLRRSLPALHGGSLVTIMLANQDLVAFVRKPRVGTGGTVVAVMNVSPRAAVVSVNSLLAGMPGSLKLLAKTSDDPAPVVSSVVVEPYGVYVAEVAGRAGLETVVLPARRRR